MRRALLITACIMATLCTAGGPARRAAVGVDDEQRVLAVTFDEGGVRDSSRFANHGSFSGGSTTAGVVSRGASFDGSADYAEADAAVNDLKPATKGTVAFWVKPVDSTPTGDEALFAVAKSSTAVDYFGVFIIATGEVQTQVAVGSLQWLLRTSTAPLASGKWSHIAVVQNGTEAAIYIDGRLQPSSFLISKDKTVWFAGLDSGVDTLNIGRIGFSSGKLNHAGDIDEVDVWNRDLSTAEILTLYQSTAP